MHYTTDSNQHGLKHDPFKALIVPRPIGWVSTISEQGVLNVAPYSFFNGVSDRPPMLMFSVAGRKDSLDNIEKTGVCTCSLATRSLAQAMNITSAPVAAEIDEFSLARLPHSPSRLVKTPRISDSPAAFECRHWKSVPLPAGNGDPESGYTLVLVEVVAIYIDDSCISDGLVDSGAMEPLARLGYMDYMAFNGDQIFSISRPTVNSAGTEVIQDEGEWDGVYR